MSANKSPSFTARRERTCCDGDCNQGRQCPQLCPQLDTPRGPISSRELRWLVAALIVFWVVLIFAVPGLLNWLLPRLAA